VVAFTEARRPEHQLQRPEQGQRRRQQLQRRRQQCHRPTATAEAAQLQQHGASTSTAAPPGTFTAAATCTHTHTHHSPLQRQFAAHFCGAARSASLCACIPQPTATAAHSACPRLPGCERPSLSAGHQPGSPPRLVSRRRGWSLTEKAERSHEGGWSLIMVEEAGLSRRRLVSHGGGWSLTEAAGPSLTRRRLVCPSVGQPRPRISESTARLAAQGTAALSDPPTPTSPVRS
jgi:hypothetical protein